MSGNQAGSNSLLICNRRSWWRCRNSINFRTFIPTVFVGCFVFIFVICGFRQLYVMKVLTSNTPPTHFFSPTFQPHWLHVEEEEGMLKDEDDSTIMARLCRKVEQSSNESLVVTTANPREIHSNRGRLRKQVPVWKRVVLMITFLNPTFDALQPLRLLYGRLFGKIVFCINTDFLPQWKSIEEERRNPFSNYWLVTFNGYSRSKDDRSYECWHQLKIRLDNIPPPRKQLRQRNQFSNYLGVLSIMDDSLINLWNFGVIHRGGGISSLPHKVWSMTNGGIFVPRRDIHASPFFIAGFNAPKGGYKYIGDRNSAVFVQNPMLNRTTNATVCYRKNIINNNGRITCWTPIWSHYGRFYDEIGKVLNEIYRASIIRQSGNQPLSNVLEKTEIFAKCWDFLQSQAARVLGVNESEKLMTAGVIGEIPADVYYLPSRLISNFVKLISVFRKHSIHPEIAIPTSISCLTSGSGKVNNKTKLPVDYHPISDAGMLWNASAKEKPWLFYNLSSVLPLLHPIKLSYMKENPVLREFLCHSVFPSYTI